MNMLKSKILILSLTILTLLLFVGCGNNYKHISQEEAIKIMETKKDYIIVDVRRKEEYDKKHIPNAILVPIEDIREGKLDALPDKDKMLMLYCWTGRRAEDAAALLVKYGYTNVYEFGGLINWTGDVEVEKVAAEN